ncbi:DUF427 domain-containing protein [Erythrobacteraceae bacterium WH01K]|nr:DUF427 domain-containing protein [Erythrobacteraceae bacterium WH01K]
MTMEARWNGESIARSDDTAIVEGNHYFPPASVNRGNLVHSDKTSHCGWKGDASYFSINAGGAMLEDAAWTYTDPLPDAEHIRDHIAFVGEVEIVED